MTNDEWLNTYKTVVLNVIWQENKTSVSVAGNIVELKLANGERLAIPAASISKFTIPVRFSRAIVEQRDDGFEPNRVLVNCILIENDGLSHHEDDLNYDWFCENIAKLMDSIRLIS